MGGGGGVNTSVILKFRSIPGCCIIINYYFFIPERVHMHPWNPLHTFNHALVWVNNCHSYLSQAVIKILNLHQNNGSGKTLDCFSNRYNRVDGDYSEKLKLR